jgi:DNA-binding MarR family transcriptional regulator
VAEPDPDENLSDAFWSVARQLRQVNREALAPWDVTPSQFRAVDTLVRHGPLRLSELSELLRIAPRSATEVVDALAERGLAERLPDPHDRRATLVRLTERGTELATAIRAARDAGTEGYFDRLSAADRAELTRILRALRAAEPAGRMR